MAGSRKGHQAEANAYVPLPVRDGVAPSYLWLLETRAGGMLRFLVERFPDVSEAAWTQRLARGEVCAAAIHLHRLDGDNDAANVDAMAIAPGLHDAVLIAFARREQGLIVAGGNPLGLGDIASIAAKRAKLALRPQGAGAQLLLLSLLAPV